MSSTLWSVTCIYVLNVNYLYIYKTHSDFSISFNTFTDKFFPNRFRDKHDNLYVKQLAERIEGPYRLIPKQK